MMEPTPTLGDTRRRWTVIGLLIVAVSVWHWGIPTLPGPFHAVHILLRKAFIAPVLLASIWFGFRGAVLSAGGVTLVYVPYVLVVWSGKTGENLNQAGELVTFWVVGLLAAYLATRERRALGRAAAVSRDALNALIAALDAREHQTETHSLRVADLSRRVGEGLGMSPPELARLHEGAVLHDVGKIGVPDRILLKPGPLTREEREVMQRHPAMGHAILCATTHLRDAAELVLCHHERYDGTGYPRGLAGEAIPLGARIFAVADVFDALTSDRPYRRAMPIAEARLTILAGSGSHFDPAVVAIFCAAVAGPDPTEVR